VSDYWLSVADAARIGRVSERTVRRLVAGGSLELRARQVSLEQLQPHLERIHRGPAARPDWSKLVACLTVE
jgi:hypothetical protein